MKLLAVYVVCAVCAGAASSLSDVDRQEVYQALDAVENNFPGTLLGLAEGNKMVQIQEIEKKINFDFLEQAMSDIISVVHVGTGPNLFKLSLSVHQALIDVSNNLRYITKNLAAAVFEVEACTNTISTIHLDNQEIDYLIKRHIVKQTIDDSLGKTGHVFELIHKAKNSLGTEVIAALRHLLSLLRPTTGEHQFSGIKKALINEAKVLKSDYKDVESKVQNILEHGKWLNDTFISLEIMDKTVYKIKTILTNTKQDSALHINLYDEFGNTGDYEKFREGSDIIVNFMRLANASIDHALDENANTRNN